MAHPNIYPGPAHANLPPAPGAETVPAPNEIMLATRWANDLDSVNHLVTELSEIQREEANLRRRVEQGIIPPREVAQYQQKIDAKRNTTYGQLDTLARGSDTTKILDVLDEHAGVAKRNYQIANERVASPSGTVAAAEDARFTASVAHVARRDLTRSHALQPIQIRKTDPPVVQKAAREELKRRAREEQIHGGAFGKAERLAIVAETERGQSLRGRNKIEGFDGSIAGLANSLRNSHDALRSNIENITDDVTDELGAWDIRYPASQGQEQYVRDRLEDLKLMMGTLSPYDQLRAQAQGTYTRLRHRLEARSILADTATNRPNPDRQYQPDGGILLYPGTSDEVVIYGNGVTARREGANGDLVYRRPAGMEVPTPLDDTQLIIGAPSRMNPDTALAAWEAERSPRTAAEAHASLSEFIDQGTNRETQIVTYLQNVENQIAANDAQITEATNYLHQMHTTLAAPRRNPTPQEQQQMQAARVNLTNAQRANQNLRNNQARADTDLATLRQNLNPSRYWKARVEVGANRQVTPAAVQARFLVGRAAQRAQDALPAAPILMKDGTILLEDAVINGQHANRWRIWPNGMTSTVDPQTGRAYYFHPDGRII